MSCYCPKCGCNRLLRNKKGKDYCPRCDWAYKDLIK